MKDLGALLLTAIIILLAIFGLPAIIAAILYFGVPFVTGFDELGYWQYFVGIFLVLIASNLVFSGFKAGRGG